MDKDYSPITKQRILLVVSVPRAFSFSAGLYVQKDSSSSPGSRSEIINFSSIMEYHMD